MKYLLLLVLPLFIYDLNAQQATVKWGNDGQRITGVDASGNITSVSNESIVALTGKKKFGGMSLEYFADMAEGLYDNCIHTANRAYFPVLLFHPSGKQNLSVVEVDSKGKIKGGLKNVLEDDFSLKMRNAGRIILDKSGIIISPDRKILAKLTPAGIMSFDKPSKWTITVLDENLKVIWHKVQEFPYSEDNFNVVDALVTNSGTVVLAADILKPKTNKKDKESHYDHKIYAIGKTDMKEGAFFEDGETINSSIKIASASDEKILISGFYVNKSNPKRSDGNVNGTYAIDFNLSSCTPDSKVFSPFDISTVKAIVGSTFKSASDGISGLSTVAVLNQNSEEYTLVAEMTTQGVVNTGTTQDRGPQVSQYASDQKLLIGYDNQLKKKFELAIPGGFGSSTKNAGIRAFSLGDKTLIIYSTGYSGNKNYNCVATLVDASGKIISTQVLTPNEHEYQLRPELCYQLDDNRIVVTLGSSGSNGHYSNTKLQEAVLTVPTTVKGH